MSGGPVPSLIEEEYDSDDLSYRRYKSNYTLSLSDKYETLDFTVKQSKLSDHHNVSRQHSYLQFYAMRWLMVGLTAAAMAMIKFITEMVIEFIITHKTMWLRIISAHFPQDIWLTYIGLAGFNVILMAIASGSCLLYALEARGGDVSSVIAYLNGTRIKRLFTVRTVSVKILSTTALVCTGSPGGQEGPFIHIGAAVGNIIPNYVARLRHSHVFNHLLNICEKRDLSVCGIAAGVSAGSGAPFAGIFLALEETTSYFSADMLPRIVVCAFLAKFLSDWMSENFLKSHSDERYYMLMKHLNLGAMMKVEETDAVEIVVSVIFGFLGVFFGVLFIILYKKQYHWRERLDLLKWKKYLFCEALANALIVTLFYVIVAAVFPHDCMPVQKEGVFVQMSCPQDQLPIISYFMFTLEEGYKLLIQAEAGLISVPFMLVLFIFLYVFMVFSSSHSYSSGFFVMHFTLGALWGRILGELMYARYPRPWADPRRFSLLGAAAQITGMARSNIFLVCLILESSNSFESCGIAIFLTTFITKMVANLCVPGIYHVKLDLKGIPFLETDAPTGTRADVEDIVQTDRELFKTTLVPRVGHLFEMTQEEKGNFPIVTAQGKIMGDISRCMIYKLLSSNVYDAIQPYPEARYRSLYKIIYGVECTIDYLKEIRQEMLLNVSDNDKLKYLDLTPFRNKNVFFVRPSASLHHIYQFFRQIGMRTLYVVDEVETLQGIITRKDLARYRTHLHMGHFHREKINVQSSASSRSPTSPDVEMTPMQAGTSRPADEDDDSDD